MSFESSDDSELPALHIESNRQVERWFAEFEKSDFFVRLSPEQKSHADFAIQSFSESMASHQGVTPEEWNEADLEEVCLELLPRKVTAEAEFYHAFAPVLSAFFCFLEERNYLRGATRLVRKVEELSAAIVREGTDPANWGMAKSLMMSAISQGVDPTSKSEMDHFIANYNRALQLSRSSLPGLYSPGSLPEIEIDRYAPCPCGSDKKYKFCCYAKAKKTGSFSC